MLGANEIVPSMVSSLSETHNVTEDTRLREPPTMALTDRNRMQTIHFKCSGSCHNK